MDRASGGGVLTTTEEPLTPEIRAVVVAELTRRSLEWIASGLVIGAFFCAAALFGIPNSAWLGIWIFWGWVVADVVILTFVGFQRRSMKPLFRKVTGPIRFRVTEEWSNKWSENASMRRRLRIGGREYRAQRIDAQLRKITMEAGTISYYPMPGLFVQNILVLAVKDAAGVILYRDSRLVEA